MRIKSPCATCLILHLFFRSIPLCSCSFLPLHVMSLALGFSFIMTKRDSCLAGFTSSRAPMSMPRRHSRFQGQPSSGATSSGQRPHPSSITDDLSLPSLSENTHSGISSPYGYTAPSSSMPLPDEPSHQAQLQPAVEEAYPLQTEIQRQNRTLHSHIFTEV